jgi:hypothetical protein
VGESAAVAPAGRPETLRLTAELKLFALVIVIVLVPLLPWATVNAAGETPRVKLGGALTVRAMVVVADRLPEVPVMVTVSVPEVAESLTVSVNTLVPVVGFEPNFAVTPLGRPVAASVTLPVNPFAGAIVMVLAALPPGATLKVLVELESVKLGETLVALPVRVNAKAIVCKFCAALVKAILFAILVTSKG